MALSVSSGVILPFQVEFHIHRTIYIRRVSVQKNCFKTMNNIIVVTLAWKSFKYESEGSAGHAFKLISTALESV